MKTHARPFRVTIHEGSRGLGSLARLDSLRAKACFALSFLDEHVEHHRWRWPKANKDPFNPPGLTAVANDQDLQDLRWLQERLPGP